MQGGQMDLKEIKERWRVAQLKMAPDFPFKQASEDVQALLSEIERLTVEVDSRKRAIHAASSSYDRLRDEVERLFRKWQPLV
jgi:phage shock protein A